MEAGFVSRSNDSQKWPFWLNSVGMDPAPDPPADADSFAVASHYVKWYEGEYVRIRNISKGRVGRVITLIATLNAGIAILGVASAAWKYPWFGLGSTALAGVAGILASRNNLFRDQELWQLRSSTLARLQQLKRDMYFRSASREDPKQLSREVLERLNEILDDDLKGWSGVSRSALTSPQGGETPPSQRASS
ncbi:hypothetical protein GCM10018775_36010 [Streptomyces umbrinus]|nr:hypothetical protein GCM10018775_36010 [Streptomyces umbrinus]